MSLFCKLLSVQSQEYKYVLFLTIFNQLESVLEILSYY